MTMAMTERAASGPKSEESPGNAGRGHPARDPPPYEGSRPSTGSRDDEDEPEDEHDGDNEARERTSSDSTELQDELEGGDEHPV